MVEPTPAAQNPQRISDADLQAAIYFAVGVASEGSLRGRNVAYEISFAGYIHHEGDTARRVPREAGTFHEGQLEPVYNSGYSIGTLQTDFGQQRNDPNRSADRLLNAYQTWAQTQAAEHPELALSQQEFEQASQALRRQGNEIRGDRTTTADNGYDIPAGIKTRLNAFMASDAGITYVHNQDVRQVNQLLRADGAVRALEATALYQGASQDDQIRMTTVIAKLENQDGNRHWPDIIRQIGDGSIDSLDGIKAGVPQHLQGDRDNALRGAEVLIALRNSDAQNPLHAAWQHVATDPLANPTQLNQDPTRPNLQAEYATIKNLLLVPDQGRALVQALDTGGTRARDIRFQGAPNDQTAGFYAAGNDFAVWNRDGHGYANINGQWSSVERSQVTRTERNGVVDLSINRNGATEPLLHVDPATPALRPPGAAPPAPEPVAPIAPIAPAPRQPDRADRDYPDQGMLEQIRNGMRNVDRSLNKPWDENSERLSASAFKMAVEKGFKPGDDIWVGLNRQTERHAAGELLLVQRAGNNVSPDPYQNRAQMPTTMALSEPASARIDQALAIRETQAETTRLQQAGADRTADDLSPGGPKMS